MSNELDKLTGEFVKLAGQVMDFLKHGKVRVLLVEDSPADVLLCRAMLATVPTRYEVDVATTPEQAKEMIRTRNHHLVMLDWHLGNGQHTGLEIAKQLHEEGVPFPFIIYTAHEEDYVEAGANDCMAWFSKMNTNPADLDATLLLALKNYHTRSVAGLAL